MAGTLLYDADCGFCTRSAAVLARLGSAVEIRPWQGYPDLAAHGLTEHEVDEIIHLVDGETILTGHRAIAEVLASSRHRPVRALGRLVGSRLLAPVASRVYAWVAANRYRLPGGGACRAR